MTPYDMLTEIGKKKGVVDLRRHSALECVRWVVLTAAHISDRMTALAAGLTPEEAIKNAHKLVFPPIKKEYGVWGWDYQVGAWYTRDGNRTYVTKHVGGYAFRGPGLEGSVMEAGLLSEQSLEHFYHLLYQKNPELKPPTEE